MPSRYFPRTIFAPNWSIRADSVLSSANGIAHEVLGPREDLDPAYDTTVRVQIGHLRGKPQAHSIFGRWTSKASPYRCSERERHYRMRS